MKEKKFLKSSGSNLDRTDFTLFTCLKKLKFRISHLLDYNELEWAKTNIDILQESTEKDICKLLLKLNSIQISIDKIISDYWLSFLNNTDN